MQVSIHKTTLHTKRLTLKPFSPKDENRLLALLTNKDITQTFMVPENISIEQLRTLAQRIIHYSQIEDTTHLEYGIYLHTTLIGFINDCGIEDTTIEIGYVIHPDYQGQGYATEAVYAVIHALKTMGFHTIRAGFFAENTASRRVMEKCGMKPIDSVETITYRGTTHACYFYEI